MPVVDIQDLTVEYSSGGYTIRPIDGLSLEVTNGSLVIVLGPSGCGKTTLLSCLGGILSATSGTIRVGEVDVGRLAGSELTRYRRNRVGIVFQAFNLVASLTALENVAVPLRYAGVDARSARRRSAELLERVGLSDRTHHRPGDLSGGQQQRVAIARALALDPPLVLADEPTAHLDYIQVEGVLRLIRGLASGERVVIVATHDHRLVPLADQVIDLAPPLDADAGAPQRVELTAGEVLFEQGSRGELIYVVERGDVEILRVHDNGSTELLGRRGPGTYFGEMGPLCGLPRSATTRARAPTVVTGYSVRSFREHFGDGDLRRMVAGSDGAEVPESHSKLQEARWPVGGPPSTR
jgi:putative ABC transport system ATP-binding protein